MPPGGLSGPVARPEGITKPVGPPYPSARGHHRCSRRGVPLPDVQEAASHADPRTTMRDDRARVSLDRDATYIVAGFLAGAAR